MSSNRIAGTIYIVLGLCAVMASMFMAMISINQFNQSQKARQNEAIQASAKAVVPYSEMTSEDPAIPADLLALVNGEGGADINDNKATAADTLGPRDAATALANTQAGAGGALRQRGSTADINTAEGAGRVTAARAAAATTVVRQKDGRPAVSIARRSNDAGRTGPGAPAERPKSKQFASVSTSRPFSEALPPMQNNRPVSAQTKQPHAKYTESIDTAPRTMASPKGFRVSRNGQLPGLVAGDMLVSRCGIEGPESASIVRQALIEARETGVPACLNVRQGGEMMTGMAVRVPPETTL